MPTVSIKYHVLGIKRFAQHTKYSKSRGFTLIELLIVITIIGILATAILASFGGAQEKTRDGRRKSDLAQVKRAMELAKSDCKGAAYYPYIPVLGGEDTPVAAYDRILDHMKSTEPKYISSKPTDPKDTIPNKYSYIPIGLPDDKKCPPIDDIRGEMTLDGVSNYVMYTKLERTSDSDAFDSRTKICADKPAFDPEPWSDSKYIGYYVICNN